MLSFSSNQHFPANDTHTTRVVPDVVSNFKVYVHVDGIVQVHFSESYKLEYNKCNLIALQPYFYFEPLFCLVLETLILPPPSFSFKNVRTRCIIWSLSICN